MLLDLFHVCIYPKSSFSGRICKVAIQEHINKTHSQNRKNLSSTNLQTKSATSENSVSPESWHMALRKCRYQFQRNRVSKKKRSFKKIML